MLAVSPLVSDVLNHRMAAIDLLHERTAIYTAEPVVSNLLDRLRWPADDRRLVDPSCGDGMFLGCALLRLLVRMPVLSEDGILARLEGWEIHPAAAAAARRRIFAILSDHGLTAAGATSISRKMVRNADFLTDGPETACYDVVAGNPPYLRAQRIPDVLRRQYEAVTPAYARADMLHSFMDRCARTLKPDGEIALVTADRWLFNMNAAGLRASLGERFGIHHLERLDASTAFYRPKQRRAGTPPRIHPVAVVLRSPDNARIQLSDAAIFPDVDDTALPPALRLDAVAHVRLAPWLGSSGIFVVNEECAARLPRECLVPAVDTDDIVDGVLGRPKRYAIMTFPDRQPPAEVLQHLEEHLPRMAASRLNRKVPWVPPERFHKLDLSKPSLLVPRIAKTLRPVRLPAGILPINHNLSIVAAGAFPLSRIEDILNRDTSNAWMQSCAARLENGYFSLTTTLLRRLPIPANDGQ